MKVERKCLLKKPFVLTSHQYLGVCFGSIAAFSISLLVASLVHAWPSGAIRNKQSTRTLTVQGEGRVSVAPDAIRILVGIDTLESSLAASRAKNAKLYRRVAAAVARSKVPGVLVKSDQVAVEIVYDSSYPKGRLPKVLGYRILNSVTILVVESNTAKLSKYGSLLLDRAVAAGANRINSVEFFVTDTRSHYKKAMALAIRDAGQNAANMAKQAGVSLGEVLTISPNWGSYYPELSSTGGHGIYSRRHAYTQASSMSSGGSGMEVAAGIFRIKATVGMTFKLR